VDKLQSLNSQMHDGQVNKEEAHPKYFDNVICLKCNKSCGMYKIPRPLDKDQDGHTKSFMCIRCLRTKITCPSCYERPMNSKKNEDKSSADLYIFDCKCACSREFEAIVTVEFLDYIEDLKVVKKVKKIKKG